MSITDTHAGFLVLLARSRFQSTDAGLRRGRRFGKAGHLPPWSGHSSMTAAPTLGFDAMAQNIIDAGAWQSAWPAHHDHPRDAA